MVVQGTLICKGLPAKHILFTSARDFGPKAAVTATAAPFDWNGIIAEAADSRILITYCAIRFSVYGLDIKHVSSQISLDKVNFEKNGSANLNRDGKIVVFVDDSLAKKYKWPLPEESAEAAPAEAVRPAAHAPVPQSYDDDRHKAKKEIALDISNQPRQPLPWKMPVQLLSGALALSGGVMAIMGKVQSDAAYNGYKSATSPAQAEQDKADYKDQNGLMISGLVLLLAGLLGISVTFVF